MEQTDGGLALEAMRLEACEVSSHYPELGVRLAEGVRWIGEAYGGWVLLAGQAEMRTEAAEVSDHTPLELAGEAAGLVCGGWAGWL